MSAPGDEMLSRVAGRLYWAGRQLIRAEDTARAILSQHGLAMTPQGRELADWPALVAALGHPPLELGKNSAGADRAAVALLAVDPENPGSVRSAVAAARENMRSARGLCRRRPGAWLPTCATGRKNRPAALWGGSRGWNCCATRFGSAAPSPACC